MEGSNSQLKRTLFTPLGSRPNTARTFYPLTSGQFRASRSESERIFGLRVFSTLMQELVGKGVFKPDGKDDHRGVVIFYRSEDLLRAANDAKYWRGHGGRDLANVNSHDYAETLSLPFPRDIYRYAVNGDGVRYGSKGESSIALWCSRGYMSAKPPTVSAPHFLPTATMFEQLNRLIKQAQELSASFETAPINVDAGKDIREERQDIRQVFDISFLEPLKQLAKALATRERVNDVLWNIIREAGGTDKKTLAIQLETVATQSKLIREIRPLRRQVLPPDLPPPAELVRYKPEAIETWLGEIQNFITTGLKENRAFMRTKMLSYISLPWSVDCDKLSSLVDAFGLRKPLEQYVKFEAASLHEASLAHTRPRILQVLEASLNRFEAEQPGASVFTIVNERMKKLTDSMDAFESDIRVLHLMSEEGMKKTKTPELSGLLCSVLEQRSDILKQLQEMYILLDKLGQSAEVEGALWLLEAQFKNLCRGDFTRRMALLNKLIFPVKKKLKAQQEREKHHGFRPSSGRKKDARISDDLLATFSDLENYSKHIETLGPVEMRKQRPMPEHVKDYAKSLQRELEQCIAGLPPIIRECCRDMVLNQTWRHSVYKLNLPQKWDLRDLLTPERLLLTMHELALKAIHTETPSGITIDRLALRNLLKEALGDEEICKHIDSIEESISKGKEKVPLEAAIGELFSLLDVLIRKNSQVYDFLQKNYVSEKTLLVPVLSEVDATANTLEASLLDLNFGPLFAFARERRVYAQYSEQLEYVQDPQTEERHPVLKITLERVSLENPNGKAVLPSQLVFVHRLDEAPVEPPSLPKPSPDEELYGKKLDLSKVLETGYDGLGSTVLHCLSGAVELNAILEDSQARRPYYAADGLLDAMARPQSGIITFKPNGELYHRLPSLIAEYEGAMLTWDPRPTPELEQKIRTHLEFYTKREIFTRLTLEMFDSMNREFRSLSKGFGEKMERSYDFLVSGKP